MLILRMFRWLFRRGPVAASAGSEKPVSNTSWCVVANVLLERAYGPGGVEKRRGTKVFGPGAKVYVLQYFWGVGGEAVTVMGRHRKSHRFIQISMRAEHLANWRVELVHSPTIVKAIHANSEFAKFDANSDQAQRRAEEIVAHYIAAGAVTQPHITRGTADD